MKNKALVLTLILLIAQSGYSEWEQLNGPIGGRIYALLVSGNKIFAGTYGGGIFYSSNDGQNWTQRNNGISELSITALGQNSTYIFTSSNDGVYRSSNNGQNWILLVPRLGNSTLSSFYSAGSFIYASTIFAGVFRSSNNGVTWQPQSNGLPSLSSVVKLSGSGNYIFAGIHGYGVFRSTNEGLLWSAVNNGLGSINVNSIKASGSVLYAATENGLYRSGNYGASWTLQNNGLVISAINREIFTGGNIFAGTYLGGVYVSNNTGQSFIDRNEGFPTDKLIITSFMIANNYIFAGVEDFNFNTSVWRRSLNEVISIKEISTEIPEGYSLHQNYPNPFNPTTNIQFAIPKTSIVKLVVFDVLGKEIAVLVNEELKAGTYKYDWNASKQASGVYYYKMTSDDFVETKKIILVK